MSDQPPHGFYSDRMMRPDLGAVVSVDRALGHDTTVVAVELPHATRSGRRCGGTFQGAITLGGGRCVATRIPCTACEREAEVEPAGDRYVQIQVRLIP